MRTFLLIVMLLAGMGCDSERERKAGQRAASPASSADARPLDPARSSVASAVSVASVEVRPAFSTIPDDTKFSYALTGCRGECEDIEFWVDASGEVTSSRSIGGLSKLDEDEVLALLNAFTAVDFMYMDTSVLEGCGESGTRVELAMRAGAHEKRLAFDRECEVDEVRVLEDLAQTLREHAIPKEEP